MKQRFQLPGSLSCGRGPWAIPGRRLLVLSRGQSRCPDFQWSTEHQHNRPRGTPTHRESAVKQTLSFCKFISLRHQGFGGQTGEVSFPSSILPLPRVCSSRTLGLGELERNPAQLQLLESFLAGLESGSCWCGTGCYVAVSPSAPSTGPGTCGNLLNVCYPG